LPIHNSKQKPHLTKFSAENNSSKNNGKITYHSPNFSSIQFFFAGQGTSRAAVANIDPKAELFDSKQKTNY
jgi:hypothetical protein